jgi:hypothetical protein
MGSEAVRRMNEEPYKVWFCAVTDNNEAFRDERIRTKIRVVLLESEKYPELFEIGIQIGSVEMNTDSKVSGVTNST